MRINEIAPGQRKNFQRNWFQTPEGFNRFWDKIIEPNCSDILSEYRYANKICFRGENGMQLIYRAASRNNRNPRDSNAFLAGVLNNCLANLGFEAIRSNSVFAISDRIAASEYGEVYMFFPVNGYKFTYINRSDLIIDTIADVMDPKLYFELNQLFKEWAIANKRTYSTLNSILLSHEMCRSSEEVLEKLREMFPNSQLVKTLTPETLFSCKAIADKFGPTKENLGVAIENGYETMFKCQYYAISYTAFFKQVGAKLGFHIIP